MIRVVAIALALLLVACASVQPPPPPPPTNVALPPPPPPPEPVFVPPPPPPVTAPVPPAVYQPAWELLPTGASEPAGYGLYSYVLIRDKPQTADEIDTTLHVIERLLYKTDRVAEALAQNDRSELNVFFFPTRTAAITGRTPKEMAHWILREYDHVRAKRILNRLAESRSGPYVVSSVRALGGAGASNGDVLIQVLTRPKRAYLADWVDYFVQRSSQPTSWSSASLREMLLQTRDHLEQIGAALPAVADDAKRIVKWVKDIAGS